MPVKMLDGNGAAVEAVRLVRPGVIAAYPITPQSSIAEHLADEVAGGRIKAEYIRVESEHSAMSVCLGAQLTGVRAVTATSSVGLALMHEVCGMTSGCRLPMVMHVVNRSLAAPWSLWCDHSDTMAERDSGWLQFYAGTVQDVLDLYLAGIRISEHPDVLTPSMICQDGFFLAHSMQKVDVPEDSAAFGFVGQYRRQNMYLDPEDPIFVNDLTPTDDYGEMRYQQMVGFRNAAAVAEEAFAEFQRRFGRRLETVRPYMLEDAEVAVVTMGSMSGTARYVVDQLRAQGIRAGALQIVMYRPFPAGAVARVLGQIPVIGVVDRSAGLGAVCPPTCTEVAAALRGKANEIRSFIGGLAGRDISNHSFERIFADLLAIRAGKRDTHCQWFDLRANPMDIRVLSGEEDAECIK